MVDIHPTAVVEPGAELGEGVRIEAYAYIGAQVRLGEGTVVRHHATVEGNTWMGARNTVFPYAFVGGKTQDLKFRGGNPGLRIGDGNTFREFCTVHCATADGDFTTVGSHNHFLSYTHIAHDCEVGSHIIISNNGTLGGHVRVGNHVVMGGLSAIHQFCRVGDFAMIGGVAKVVQDVAPYIIADGNPARSRAYNKVGLERNGFTVEQLGMVRTIYKTFFRGGLNHKQACEKLHELPIAADPIVQRFTGFVEASERGIC